MAQYFAIINSIERFPLFMWDANFFNVNMQLRLATDNLTQVRQAFDSIQSISIVDETDLEVAFFTEYDSFSAISYLGRNFSSQIEFYDS